MTNFAMKGMGGYTDQFLIVMYDISSSNNAERRDADKFHRRLKKEGFSKMHKCTYGRYCLSKEKVQAYKDIIKSVLPFDADVQFISMSSKIFSKNFEQAFGGIRHASKCSCNICAQKTAPAGEGRGVSEEPVSGRPGKS